MNRRTLLQSFTALLMAPLGKWLPRKDKAPPSPPACDCDSGSDLVVGSVVRVSRDVEAGELLYWAVCEGYVTFIP